MYLYLDRPVASLDEHQRFLIAAIRTWVLCARAGRCPCGPLVAPFARRGVQEGLRDFLMAMATLDHDGIETLQFGPHDATMTTDGEARVLTLFDAAIAGEGARVRRIAATLVAQDAAGRLANAAEWVALPFANGTIARREG